jgi:ribosome biogenesis SPOUT family RNA methylase Rps3
MDYNITQKQFILEIIHIQSLVFKILPYFEEEYEYLDEYFESVLQRLGGINIILKNPPEILSVIALVELARTTKSKSKIRKLVLDACGILDKIKESDPNA